MALKYLEDPPPPPKIPVRRDLRIIKLEGFSGNKRCEMRQLSRFCEILFQNSIQFVFSDYIRVLYCQNTAYKQNISHRFEKYIIKRNHITIKGLCMEPLSISLSLKTYLRKCDYVHFVTSDELEPDIISYLNTVKEYVQSINYSAMMWIVTLTHV